MYIKEGSLSISIYFFLFFVTINAMAAPIRPIGPVDVTGTVSEIKWVPEKKVKYLKKYLFCEVSANSGRVIAGARFIHYNVIKRGIAYVNE